jgi:hypothetical protein
MIFYHIFLSAFATVFPDRFLAGIYVPKKLVNAAIPNMAQNTFVGKINSNGNSINVENCASNEVPTAKPENG